MSAHEAAARCATCEFALPLRLLKQQPNGSWICGVCETQESIQARYGITPLDHTVPPCTSCGTHSNVVAALRLCLGCATALQEIGQSDQEQAAKEAQR